MMKMDPIGLQLKKCIKLFWIIIILILITIFLPLKFKIKLIIVVTLFSISEIYNISNTFRYKYGFSSVLYPGDSFRKKYYKLIAIMDLFIVITLISALIFSII